MLDLGAQSPKRKAAILATIACMFALGSVFFGPASTLSIVGGLALVLFGAMWPFLWFASWLDRTHFATPDEAPDYQPLISILAPARNEETVVAQMVTQMLEQTYQNWELYVIANNCTDSTAEVARQAAAGDPRVIVYECTFENGTKADALNRVLPLVSGEILVQFDTDNTIKPDYLAGLAAAFSDPEVSAVQTQIRAHNQREGLLAMLQDIEFLVYSEVFNRGRQAVGLSSSIGGTGFAIRTHIIREMGGWSRDLVEDFELHMRLVSKGIKVGYLRSVSVFDEKPLSWGALIRQRKRWVRGHLIIAERRLGQRGLGVMDQVYLFSPVFIGLSMTLLALGYVFYVAPAVLDGYAYFSPLLWFASLIITAVAVSAAIWRAGEKHMLPLVPIYLLVFGFHWMVVFIAAMKPVSWGASKTVHGCVHEGGVREWLGLDGGESVRVALTVLTISALWVTPLGFGLHHEFSKLVTNEFSDVGPLIHYASHSYAIAEAEGDPLPSGERCVGVVHDSQGNPLEGATVTVTLISNGGVQKTTTTGSDGRFAISDMASGTWRIDIELSGFETASTEFILPTTGYVLVDARLAPVGGGIGAIPIPY
ncbi:MAG: hypothetical protein Kow0056_05790 [Coriobacteriia bacterium]